MSQKISAEILVDDGLLTVKQASKFVSLSVASLYGTMARGESAYVKLGKSRRIPRRALISLAARHLVTREVMDTDQEGKGGGLKEK